MTKQLYRSKNNRVISGVCGGLAEYLDLDPTLIRLLWIIITLSGGIGFIAYLVSIIIISENPYQIRKEDSAGEQMMLFENTSNASEENNGKNRILVGAVLVLLGTVFLLKQFVHWINFGKLWPLVLVAGGVYMIYRGKESKGDEK